MRKISACLFIFNIILASFAFAFLLSETVSGADGTTGVVANINSVDLASFTSQAKPAGAQYYWKTGDLFLKTDGTKVYRWGISGWEKSTFNPGDIKAGLKNNRFLDISPTNPAGSASEITPPSAANIPAKALSVAPRLSDKVAALDNLKFGDTAIPKGTELTLNPNTGTYQGTDIAGNSIELTPEQVASQSNSFTGTSYGSKLSEFVLQKGTPTSGWTGIGGFFDGLFTGLQWAAIAYGVGMLAGSLLGLSSRNTQALSTSLAAGFGTYGALSTWAPNLGLFGTGLISMSAAWGGVAGIVVLYLIWTDEKVKVITISCDAWEAPKGGSNCEKCNNELHACSEYRCNSLGQSCAFLNAGTAKEMCANNASGDVKSPIMKAWDYYLNKKYVFKPNTAVRPPDNGVKITNTEASDGCLKAFTPIIIGVITDEPAQCKIDYNRTAKYKDMKTFMDGSNLYLYNHTQTLSLPSPQALEDDSKLTLKNNGVFNLYVRCQDVNGNANDDLFIFNFCVEKGPDATPPIIEQTSISNGMPVQYGLNETLLDVYTNEPATCKWSRDSKLSYDRMETTMSFSQHVYEMNNQMLYKCTTTLNGLQNARDNIFWFKCKDQPWLGNSSDRNENDGYQFTLKGSENSLLITDVKPNGTIQGSGNVAEVNFELKTEYGSNKGEAYCSYSPTNNQKDLIPMLETGKNKHKQTIYLQAGSYIYYFSCTDLGGNTASDLASFNVEIDKTPPSVTRIYNEAGKLKILTNEDSTCTYSTNNERACAFLINDGSNMPKTNSTEHYAEWTKDTFYVKCMDKSGNQPDSGSCSIIVKPQ